MIEVLAALVLWHPELSLVPLVVGVLIPAMGLGLLERSSSLLVACIVPAVVAFVGCYIGWTSLLASVEAESIFDPVGFVVLLGAFGLLAFGVLLGFVTYWRFLPGADKEVYEPEVESVRRRWPDSPDPQPGD